MTRKLGENIRSQSHHTSVFCFLDLTFLNLREDIRQLLTKEYRHDGRRSFVSTETVIICCGCNAESEKILVFVNSFNKGSAEEEEHFVLARRLTRFEKVHSGVGCN